ncbi:hypothetical protein [Wolbachia sp. wLmal]
MRYLLSEERCNKAIPVSSTGMTEGGARMTETKSYIENRLGIFNFCMYT